MFFSPALLLAGLAVAISLFALALAVVHDLRARDGLARRTNEQHAPSSAAQPTLRLWRPSPTTVLQEDIRQSAAVGSSRDPDIVFGPWPLRSTGRGAADPANGKAA